MPVEMVQIEALKRMLAQVPRFVPQGRVAQIARGTVEVSGLPARLGDRVTLDPGGPGQVSGEVLALRPGVATVLTEGPAEELRLGGPVLLEGPGRIAPDESWLGRVVDPFGAPLDGRPLAQGPVALPLRRAAPPATERGRLGARLRTGLAVFDTLLPVVKGQRLGLFAGSGVGKSTLLANLARGVEADVVVIALVGERGRELRDFIEDVMGPTMERTVIVAATSDLSPLVRRRCAWAAMTVAEYFRDQGKHVLFLADSITRYAEAHREIALAAGESASLRGFPPSTSQMIMGLAERAGPGLGEGSITALMTVLVAGSDMEEPVADILRGVLDGHVVLDRAIAERGRFPAVDVLRSVSRSLPGAASAEENALIRDARRTMGRYAASAMMVEAGLYQAGGDAELDRAIALWPRLDAFVGERTEGVAESFELLRAALDG